MSEKREAAPEEGKVVLVVRETRLEQLVAQYNTLEQTQFVIESRGGTFEDTLAEHNAYREAIKTVQATLSDKARIQCVSREYLPNYIFGPEDIVVVIGQDGLVANTLKYLDGHPVIGINPEPSRYDGVLLPFEVKDLAKVFSDVSHARFQSREITMAQATLNDGQRMIAVNELFIGPRFQTSAFYDLRIDEKHERQSSSGVIVSTGLGSTGWLKSVAAGAAGVSGRTTKSFEMPWEERLLTYAVREPFPSQTTGTDLVFGSIASENVFTMTSLMANNGVIFSDGMIDDCIEFNSGAIVEISLASKRGRLVC